MMRIICRDVIEKISLMNDIKIRMICDSLITRTNLHTDLQRRLAISPQPSALSPQPLVFGPWSSVRLGGRCCGRGPLPAVRCTSTRNA